MKIIVTGGAGFIGSHIVDAYLAAGHTVVVIDNLSKGFRRNLNPKATFHKADITDLAAMERIFKKERPEAVNHHAALAEVVASVRNPEPTLTTNVIGTANVLMAFGRYGREPKTSRSAASRTRGHVGAAHRRFIFASTGGAMYGDPQRVPVNEDAPQEPLSPYGLSKLLGEDTVHYYARQFGFTPVIFRYANVFGPRQNPKGEAGIVAIFGGLMKKGLRPTIFGDGTKSRDYIYVGDVAAANLAALTRGAARAGGRPAVFNIGRGILTTDRAMFDAIAHEAGYATPPKFAPFRPGEITRISLDASRARRALGWKPRTDIPEGVRNALKEIRG
jgi:UDP-glucose 4-epimerase